MLWDMAFTFSPLIIVVKGLHWNRPFMRDFGHRRQRLVLVVVLIIVVVRLVVVHGGEVHRRLLLMHCRQLVQHRRMLFLDVKRGRRSGALVVLFVVILAVLHVRHEPRKPVIRHNVPQLHRSALQLGQHRARCAIDDTLHLVSDRVFPIAECVCVKEKKIY